MPDIAPENQKFRFLIIPGAFVILLWLVFGFDYLFELDLGRFAVEPRTWNGLLGVLFFPVLHGGLDHIVANSTSILVLLAATRYIFPKIFLHVFAISYILPGILTWIIGRPALHLGASGMIYALVVFLFISGVIRVNRYLLAISLLVVFVYGSLFWGLFPLEQGISWEGHLSGAFTGFLLGVLYRKIDPTDEVIEHEPDWGEDENDENDENEPPFDDWKNEDQKPVNEASPKITITYHYKENDEPKAP
jgi:membrane associated rhomboid family serine protease